MDAFGSHESPEENNITNPRKVRKPRSKQQTTQQGKKDSMKNSNKNLPNSTEQGFNNNGQSPDSPFNMVVSDAMAVNSRQLLYAHVYNYLIQNSYYETAKRFLKEAEVPLSDLSNPKATNNNSLNFKDFNSNNQLLKSKMIISSPDTFLLEWWQSLLLLNNFVDSTPIEELSSKLDFSIQQSNNQPKVVPILPLQRSANPYNNTNTPNVHMQQSNANAPNNNNNNIPKEYMNNIKSQQQAQQQQPVQAEAQQRKANAQNMLPNGQYRLSPQQQQHQQMANGMSMNPGMVPPYIQQQQQQQMMQTQYPNMMNVPQQQHVINETGQVVYPSTAQDINSNQPNSRMNSGSNNFDMFQPNNKNNINSSNQQRQVQAQFASQKRKHSENLRNSSPHTQTNNQSRLQQTQYQTSNVPNNQVSSSGSPKVSDMPDSNMKMDFQDSGMQQQYMSMLKSMLVKNQTPGQQPQQQQSQQQQQNGSSENAMIDFTMMNFNMPNQNNDMSSSSSNNNNEMSLLNKNGKPGDNTNNDLNSMNE